MAMLIRNCVNTYVMNPRFLVLIWSFLQAALVAGGGEHVFSHRSVELGPHWAGTASAPVIDDPGLRLIAAEFMADIQQIGSLLPPSTDAAVGTGIMRAWPSANDERLKGAMHGFMSQPTTHASVALQALHQPAAPKIRLPAVPPNDTKKSGGKDSAKVVPKSDAKKSGGKDSAKAKEVNEKEELVTSLYLWFAVGTLFMSFVFCCCVGEFIDPESVFFNFIVDLVIITSAVFIAMDLANPDEKDRFIIAQHCFTAFFMLEVVIRIRALGISFFSEFWGIFDFTLVWAAAVELWILPIVSYIMKDSGLEYLTEYDWLPNLVRSLRLLRLLRLFRLLRPESSFRAQKDDKEGMDDLAEVWVMIPKDGGKVGKSRSKTMAAP